MVGRLQLEKNINFFDNVIYAELSSKKRFPLSFDYVSTFMMYSPCGLAGLNSPSMKYI